MTIEGASRLVKANVFAVGQLIGLTEHGHALYCGPQRTLVARPTGPRPEGVESIPAASRMVA